MKIDNGLCFGEANNKFSTDLTSYPHMKEEMSDEIKKIILNTDITAILKEMETYGKDKKSQEAFLNRMTKMKDLATRVNITLEIFHKEMKSLKK